MNTGGYDIYTLVSTKDYFVYAYDNSASGIFESFFIGQDRNEFSAFIHHLENLQGQIGFGNTKYEYQLLHQIISSRESLKLLSGASIATLINNFVKLLQEPTYEIVQSKDYWIPQYDMKSLLGYEPETTIDIVAARLDLGERPDDPDKELQWTIATIKEIYKIVSGNSTLPLYRGMNLLNTRRFFYEKYKLKCINYSNIKLGEKFIIKKLGNEIRTTDGTVKSMIFDVASYVPAFVERISNVEARRYFSSLQQSAPSSTTPKLKGSAVFGNIAVSYNNGSIKGSIEPGIYECGSDEKIMSIDIASAFASIIVNQSLAPSGLPAEDFVAAVSELLKMRFDAIDKGDKVMADTIKKMLVSIYGKFGEEKSLLYDKTIQTKICIFAQSLMSRLLDMISFVDDEVEFLFVNTDGLCLKTKKSKAIEFALEMCNEIQDYRLKTNYYNKLYLGDTGNYALIGDNCEYKGLFDDNISLFRHPVQRKAATIVKGYLLDNQPIDTFSGYGDKCLNIAKAMIEKVRFRQYSLF